MTSAQTLFDTGISQHKSGDLQGALQSLSAAVAADGSNPAWWVQLGVVQGKIGLWDQALQSNQKALDLNNMQADAAHNAGMCLTHLGAREQAIGYYELSYAMAPDPELAENLANAFLEAKDYAKASQYYGEAHRLKPGDKNLVSRWAITAAASGDVSSAVQAYHQWIYRFPKDTGAIDGLLAIVANFNYTEYSDASRRVMLTCLQAKNSYRIALAKSWSSLVMLDPRLAPLMTDTPIHGLAECLDDELLCDGLSDLPIVSIPLEKIMTDVRRRFLMSVDSMDTWPKTALSFLCALGMQSFYNEYVFVERDDEKQALNSLQAHIEKLKAADSWDAADLLRIALFSAYRPLNSIFKSDDFKKLTKGQKYLIRDLVTHQVANVETENSFKAQFPAFGHIEDTVSMKVREQYESKPYPRWRNTHTTTIVKDPALQGAGIRLLVAGCGTGQEPVKYLTQLPKCHVTAVDLSLSSMAYARRMCDQYGLSSRLTFRHGSLLDIAALNEQFDVISSSGVLHHLENPQAGLDALASVLKPGGRLHIALYSQIARDMMFGPAWAYIREKGYTNSDADIRRFRADVLAMGDENPVLACSFVSDFFNLSECCDLLFHVQEHRLTLPRIDEMAKKAGLEIMKVGLKTDYRAKYAKAHPHDRNLTDITALHRFEEENPMAFLGMYPVWLRHRGNPAPHPTDTLIETSVL